MLECADGNEPVLGSCGESSFTGWPCHGQPGRGQYNLVTGLSGSEPWYAWRNGPETTCASTTSGDCTNDRSFEGAPATHIKGTAHANMNVDFVDNTEKPAYTPYTYPHPLRNEGTGGTATIGAGGTIGLGVGGTITLQ